MTTPAPTSGEQVGGGDALAPLLAGHDDKAAAPAEEEEEANLEEVMAALVANRPGLVAAANDGEIPFTPAAAVTAEQMEDGRHLDNAIMAPPRYNPVASSDAPTEGVWKDSTCDWIVLVCVTLWCPIVALGQVMTRLRLDWLARPLPPTEVRYSTCFIVTCIVALPWLLHMVSLTLMFREAEQQPQGGDDTNNGEHKNHEDDINIHFGYMDIDPLANWHSPLISLLGLMVAVWRFYILCQTRRTLRRRDNIREECCCIGWEDCCCACCCPQISIYQMSRHTGDFDRQQAVCCNATGLRDRPTRQLPPLLV